MFKVSLPPANDIKKKNPEMSQYLGFFLQLCIHRNLRIFG